MLSQDWIGVARVDVPNAHRRPMDRWYQRCIVELIGFEYTEILVAYLFFTTTRRDPILSLCPGVYTSNSRFVEIHQNKVYVDIGISSRESISFILIPNVDFVFLHSAAEPVFHD